jgi:hypothetical protein
MALKGKGGSRDSEDEDDGDLFPPVKEIVTKLKQGPMNFGCFLTGDKDNPVVLAAHKRKAAEVLGKKAKKKAETPKGAFGTLTLDEGGQLTFQCDTDDAPSALGKRIRKMLKAEGLAKFKILILLPGGVELGESDDEDDEEDEDDGRKTGAKADEGGDDPLAALREKAKAEYDALVQKIEAAGDDIAKPVAKKIAGLRSMFDAEIDRDPKKGGGVVSLLTKVMEAAGIGAEKPSGAASRAGALADLERGIDALLAQFA